MFGSLGDVSLDEDGNIVVRLTGDVSGTVVIPNNVGAVTIDLNGHDMVGDGGGLEETALPDGPAIRIVPGEGEGDTTRLTIGDTSDGEKGQIVGGGESEGIEFAEDAKPGVRLDIEDDVSVLNGDGTEQDWHALSPVEYTLPAGEYFKKTLAELGYDVPTNGTPYSVVAKGLPAGLQLKNNAAVTKKVKVKGKVKTIVVKPAKTQWWIEGVPTAAMDFFTNPPYLVITANGETTTEALPVEVAAQEIVDLGELELGQSVNTNGWLAGVGAGWTVSGLPTGLKYATKKITKKSGKKTVTVAEAYAIYGKTTKAGLFTITAKKKMGAYYETMKYRVLVRPAAVDAALFGGLPTNLVTMAYVPVAWDLVEGGSGRLGEAALPGGAALPVVPTMAKVAGLPGGVAFASANVYAYANAKKKTGKYLKQYGQTIMGTPTKPGTYVVTFTRNVKEKVKGKVKIVAKTAQILWVVEPNDAKVELGFNDAGGVIESGVVGLKYGDLLAFSVTSNATVTASGLPAGIKLARLDEGGSRPVATKSSTDATVRVPPVWWGFEGFTAKVGTYLVTVKATLNGKTVMQRLALKVEGLPAWAKGTFNGCVLGTGNGEGGTGGSRPVATNGLATITVSAAGKISGKFQEFGTNWTFSAESYTAVVPDTQDACPYQEFICSNIVAKYAYKVKEKVKGKVKTVTKYVTREFAFTVSPVPVVPDVSDVPVRGVATMTETDATGRVPPEQATEITAWQNLWGRADYKAVGKELFTSKSGKKTLNYKVFTINGTDDAGKEIGLTDAMTLSLKVTTAGAVTATLAFDTGKTKKDPKTKKMVKVIYKPTCQTVVVPQVAADVEPFEGEVPLYFAPSAANGFEGLAGTVPLSLP